jgi:hypothetical protein
MVRGTLVPPSSKRFTAQRSPIDCPDDFLANVLAPPEFVPIHRAFQFSSFILFLGLVKLCVALIVFALWVGVLAILPLFRRFFADPLAFKIWARSVARHFVRIFLLALGVIRINVCGEPSRNARIYASNSLCFLDYLVHFVVAPITIVTKSMVPGYERFLVGSVFDSCPLDCPEKRKRSRGRLRYRVNDAASDPSYFPLLLFPEGATTTGDAVIQFDPELFPTDYAVQPVALQYCLALTPRGFNSLHGGESSVFGVVYRVLCVPWITVTVGYVGIETPKGEGDGGKGAIACQLALANHIGVRAVAKGIHDVVTESTTSSVASFPEKSTASLGIDRKRRPP